MIYTADVRENPRKRCVRKKSRGGAAAAAALVPRVMHPY